MTLGLDFKAAVFDMDGTLINSMMYWRYTALEFMLHHQLLPDDALLCRMYGTSSRALLKEIVPMLGPDYDAETLVPELESYMHRHYLYDVHEKPMVKEYLEKLRAEGVRMCVATGAPRAYARDGLSRLGLADYFEFITDGYEFGITKASPAYFELMAEKLGARTGEVCVFEDALYAIESAKRAGCSVIAFEDGTQGATRAGILRLSDRFVRGYAELL